MKVAGTRVLLADDDRTSRTIVASALRRSGFDVTTAADGTQAWELLSAGDFRLAILDWMMPGIDGLELCRRIRRDPVHSQAYLILLTGRTSREDLVAGLDAGADDYITKPFHPNELRARLHVGIRLLDAHTESERLLSSISSILIGIDGGGRVTRWNAAAQDTFGLSPAEAIGEPLTNCGIAWTDPELVTRMLNDPERWSHFDDVRFRDTSGRDRVLLLTVTSMQAEASTDATHLVLGSEVTERRSLEAQLRQAQKLEGIGQLAAGIAHEINTPMQYIGDNVRFLGEAVRDLDPVFALVLTLCGERHQTSPEQMAAQVEALSSEVARADLEFLRGNLPDAVAQSLEGVGHVSRIVKAMKEFSHPGSGEKVPVDLNRAIETTLVVARNELKYVADVITELDADLPPVPCLSGEINQVVLNLVINAAHAIGDVVGSHSGQMGRITVSTHTVDGAAEIRISDTGGGIPEHVRPRLFEPFFTTKGVGRGTGQGLAMAHATIVGRHGGQIWFDTELGTGTTFFVRLPLTAKDTTAKESKAA